MEPNAIPPSTQAAIVAAQAAAQTRPGFAEDVAKFDSLMATFNNADGKATEADRVKAYEDIFSMTVTNRLVGLDDARRQQNNDLSKSDIGRRSAALGEAYVRSLQAAAASSDGSSRALAVTRADEAFFSGLSESDQNVLFRTQINGSDYTGKKRFSDVEGFRANQAAQTQLQTYIQDSGVRGPTGQVDPEKASALAASDSKFASALNLLNAPNTDAPSWTEQVLTLFSTPQDKLELSEEAKKIVGDVKSKTGPAEYREGSVFSAKV